MTMIHQLIIINTNSNQCAHLTTNGDAPRGATVLHGPHQPLGLQLPDLIFIPPLPLAQQGLCLVLPLSGQSSH